MRLVAAACRRVLVFNSATRLLDAKCAELCSKILVQKTSYTPWHRGDGDGDDDDER